MIIKMNTQNLCYFNFDILCGQLMLSFMLNISDSEECKNKYCLASVNFISYVNHFIKFDYL